MGQLEDMQVFIRVVEAGGIGRAAQQLGLAKSAVSRRLSELEKRLGSRLIQRTTRTSSLTDAGQSYYQQVLKLVDEVDEINSELQDDECAVTGRLRLAVPLSFGLLHLTPAIDEFIQRHPQLTITLDFSDRQVDIVEEGFDLALRIGPLHGATTQARKLFESQHVLAASADYLARHGTPATPQDLDAHSVLKYAGGTSGPWSITDRRGTRHTPNMATRIVANNGDFLLHMACAGHGIVMLPTFIAAQSLERGALVRVLADCALPSQDAFFIYPRNRYLPKRARLLIDFMVERFGGHPYWDAWASDSSA